MKTKLHFLILLFCATTATQAQTTLISEGFENVPALTAGTTTILSENFDNISALSVGGWTQYNASVPVGNTGYFEGGGSIPAQSGAATSCIQADFDNVGNSTSPISNWLITPTRNLQNGDVIEFWTRTSFINFFGDRLQLRLSELGNNSVLPNSATDIGSFTTEYGNVNGGEVSGGYPNDYKLYRCTIFGLSGPTDCRFAFRYYTQNNQNANIISIDTFSIKRNGSSSWSIYNTSLPIGTSSWYQGGGSIHSQSGTTETCILADLNSVDGNNTISNWLIAPSKTLQNGDLIKFWTRGVLSNFADRLEVRLSLLRTGSYAPESPSNLGSYSTILTTINPTLNIGGYPEVWTEYSLPISGLFGFTGCRIAFRYFVTNGGPSGINSNLIAIDTFSIVRPALANANFDLASKITISPNPVIDRFELNLTGEVDVSNLKVEIYDLNGRVIKTFEKSNSYSIADLESGVYIVTISDGNFAETKRIVKN